MIALTLQEVCDLCGGRLEGDRAERMVRSLSTDTRTLAPGDLFVALAGERFDGGAFVSAAAAAGAAAAVVGAAAGAKAPAAGIPSVLVDDGLAALQRLAAAVRRRLAVKVVAVTGSTGKTSTKDILAALLRPLAATVATQGNFNNEVGVPLTLLEADERTEVVVAELAMRGRGQIRELARLSSPDVGVITNIAPVHLELVGGLEDVAAAKAELIEEMGERAVVVPAAERLLEPAVRNHRGRVITFGAADADVRLVEAAASAEGTSAVVEAFGRRADLRFNFRGHHYLTDALAALAAFTQLGYPLEAAREGAGQVRFSALRGEIVALRGGGLLLNDAYNANPLAVRAAVDHLVQLAGGRPTVAVLGDMYELGPQAARFHTEVGHHVASCGVRLVAVGELGRHYLVGAPGETWYATVEECLEDLPGSMPPGAAVLVKASRGLRLERVAQALAAALAAPADDDAGAVDRV